MHVAQDSAHHKLWLVFKIPVIYPFAVTPLHK